MRRTRWRPDPVRAMGPVLVARPALCAGAGERGQFQGQLKVTLTGSFRAA